MPVTRSTSGKKNSTMETPEQSSNATPATTSTSATETEMTDTKRNTEISTEREISTTPVQSNPEPAPSVSRTIRTTSSRRALRLAQAREKALKIELELAKAQIATIEAEDSEDDHVTVLSTYEQRVDDWLESNQRLAITDAPHDEVPQRRPPAPQSPRPQQVSPRARHTIEGAGLDDATAEHIETGPLPFVAATAHVGKSPPHFTAAYIPAPQPQGPDFTSPPIADKNEEQRHIVATPPQRVDLSELASAIAFAARSGNREASRINVELPQFTGAYQDWLLFRAAYNESAPNYNDADNLSRLRKSLKGKAKEAVENLLIYNTHAAEVMKTLESRFGRPDTIALAELERLRALPRLTDTPRDICVFACRVANTTATLKALNRAHYLFSPETTKSVLEKLTPTLRYRWFDYAATVQNNEEPELLKLSTFIQREADFCAPYAQPENVEHSGPSHVTKRTQRAFVTTEQKVHKCARCSDTGHSIDKCPKFLKEDVNDRWKAVKNLRLCFRCLRYRNKTHYCKRVTCGQDGCEYAHHKLLHNVKKEQEAAHETVASTWVPRTSQAYLKIAPVTISGPAGAVKTYALLDDGSTVTLVDEELAREAGLDGPTEPLRIEAISNQKLVRSSSRRVKIHLQGANEAHEITARTIDDLRLSPQSIKNEDLQHCDHLRDIEENLRYIAAKPRLLIGQDNWHLLISCKTRRGQRHQPVASLTPLGWVLHGAHTRSIGKQIHSTYHVTTVDESSEDNMNKQLSKYFAIENLLVEPKRPQSDPEERALTQLMNSTTKNDDGHYETPLLWKTDDARLPDNYENTLQRLRNIEKKLDKDERFKQRYAKEMDALLTKGYAEPAPRQKGKRVWYLPHFAVLNPMKPDKVRIVHDAAAKTRGVSLNDRLLTGPDLLQSLPGVLMRFRQHPVAVGADIKEMFMQVKVQPDDRDALRYLWRGDRRDDTPPREYRMTSLIFGATCSPSIAIYVKNTNAERFKETYPDAVSSIVRNHYVDDYLQSFTSEQEAIRVANEVRNIHKEARYERRQWTSNCKNVLEKIATKPAHHEDVELSKSEMKNERILGQIWKPATDMLAFNLDLTRLPPGALDNTEPTKRQVLRIMMSVFDPLGLASPVTVNAKKLLQEVWRRGTDWDAKIDSDLAQQWAQWTHHLRALRDVTIPRCYPHYSDAVTRELHVFVDASETAYTTAIYWRVTTADHHVHVSLAAAKAKVAPLKITSIPRLELQAAVLGSRLAAAVIQEHDHKPEKRTFWTDSRTVLAWLRAGARTYRPFVAHRIAAIEENTAVNEWRWVPTKQNVADEATREVPQDFGGRHRWFTGPEFLYDEPATWPVEPPQQHKQETSEEKVHVATENKIEPYKWLPSPSRYSKWERMLRTVGRVLQFIDLCRPHKARSHYKRSAKNKQADPDWTKQRKVVAPQPPSRNPRKEKIFKTLESKYIREAERWVIRASQYETFADELKSLQKDKPPSLQSRLRPLAVELINGLITLKTRIDAAADITEAQKRPPVLDGNHAAVKLYIEYVHRKLNHAGVETTINECKQHYRILRTRPVTKMILHRCLPCRIRKTAPPVPPTGDHPRSRLAHHERPFTYTGFDYFGPITVTVGRSTQKRYVALFTCLTVRAVHLEVVPSLTGDSAVMALRRMIARRGCPTELWSDNGTNFHAADKELRQAYHEATQEEATRHQITWRFIPAGAPFMGGAWERLVRSSKVALNAVLHDRHPSDETLATLLAEAEYTVNSRPLTHVSVDPCDPEAITPNHFLLGGSARVPTPGTFDDTALIGRTTWKTSQRLADHFWSRWLREYLPTLQDRREPHGRGPPIAVGDVVLIVDGTLPRNTWPRGRVVATYPGPDGVTRAVDVKTRGGVLRRPTKKLVILPTTSADLHHDEMQRSTERCTAGEMFRTAMIDL